MHTALRQMMQGFSQWLAVPAQPRPYVRRSRAADRQALRGDFRQVGRQLTQTLEQHGESLGYRTR